MNSIIQFWSEVHLSPTFADIPEQIRSVRIGSADDNDIQLDSTLVAAHAAVLERKNSIWQLTSLSDKRCEIDGQPVARGTIQQLESTSTISVPPYTFAFGSVRRKEEAVEDPSQMISDFVREVHVALLEKMDLDASDQKRRNNARFIVQVEHTIEEVAREERLAERSGLAEELAKTSVKQQVIRDFIEATEEESVPAPSDGLTSRIRDVHQPWSRLETRMPHLEQKLDQLRKTIRARLDCSDALADQISAVEVQFDSIWSDISAALFPEFLEYIALRELKKQTKDMVFGYGPLEDLLRMPTVSEIMVVSSDRIYVEKNGVVENSGRRFTSDDVTESVIKRIVERVGKTIDRSRPLVDARLVDGSRVNAVIPPIALSGPCVTVRKFPQNPLSMAELVSSKRALTETVAMFLKACVEAQRNIIVAGGTGTGKTTLLNCLSEYIPDTNRIVTIEDTAELQLSKKHVVRLETKQSNAEGAGEYTIRHLLKNALRMRPDRIVVGECRGPEALDMLQAMNTGHDGSLTTIHANSPTDVQLRLEVLVRMATELPVDAIHRQIASAVHLIVQLQRLRNGRRVISHVTEVVGLDQQRGRVRLKDLFRTELHNDEPTLMPTGYLPTFMDKLQAHQLLDLDAFFR